MAGWYLPLSGWAVRAVPGTGGPPKLKQTRAFPDFTFLLEPSRMNSTQSLHALSAADLDAIARLTREAGALIMEVYATDFAVRGKDDASPVTEADEKAEALLLKGLAALYPDIPVV